MTLQQLANFLAMHALRCSVCLIPSGGYRVELHQGKEVVGNGIARTLHDAVYAACTDFGTRGARLQ